LRVNSRLISVAAYLDLLGEQNIAATAHEHARDGVILTAATGVDQLPYFAAGYVSVQDAAPQLAADLLDVQPGLRVLDVCAAPGGKTCHLLEKEAHLQELIALDIEPQRLLKVRENLTRLQLQATLITGDGTCPQDWWQGQLFDRILLMRRVLRPVLFAGILTSSG
jgi:16S rRNA (cytosine967-C5)-methyltransferase